MDKVTSVLIVSTYICFGVIVINNYESDRSFSEIDTSTVLFETDERFLSVALDTSFMRKKFHELNERQWKRLAYLANLLYPTYIRLGGTDADRLVFGTTYSRSNNITAESENDDSQITVTEDDWQKLHHFVELAKTDLIFDLNVLLRDKDSWNSSNAEALIKFSADSGFQMDFQLGNEPDSFFHVFNCTVPPEALARDFKKLHHILSLSTFYNSSKVIGPDVTRSHSRGYMQRFLESGGVMNVDAVSWHQYYLNGRIATLDDFINVDTLELLQEQILAMEEVIRTFSAGIPIWLSETSSAYGGGAPGLSDRYVAGFLWLDKLGTAAKLRLSVIIRQSLFKGVYSLIDDNLSPRPDYWISYFYKRLVGPKVLNIKTSDENVRLYVQCSSKTVLKRLQLTQESLLTVFGINLSNKLKTIVLSKNSTAAYVSREFQFTPDGGNLTSELILLNGHKLEEKFIKDFEQDFLYLTSPMNVTTVKMAPYSMCFWILQEYISDLCS